MSIPTKAPLPVDEAEQALAVPEASEAVGLFERLARDPSVDVEKLERLIAMQEHILAINARAAFDAAFAQMQGELPEIDEKGRIVVDGQVRSAYAKNEDIQKFIKPTLKKYGFALSFRERSAENGKIAIVGILSHSGGHREEDQFVAAADDSGRKNAIQARGSTRSYGQRYTTIFLLNIGTRESGFADDDGQSSERPEPPAGYDEWLLDMTACADEGLPKLTAAWNKSQKAFREFAAKHDRSTWENLKTKAKGGAQ